MMASCHSDDSVLSPFALFLIHEDSIIQGHSYKLSFICYFLSVKLGVKYEGKQMAIDSVGEEGAAGNSLI
jgi:hypothetical protein